jgi:hypothetical protein
MSQKYFELIKGMDSNKAMVRIAKKLVAQIIIVLKKEAYKVIK